MAVKPQPNSKEPEAEKLSDKSSEVIEVRFSQMKIEQCILEIRFPATLAQINNRYKFWRTLQNTFTGNYHFSSNEEEEVVTINNKFQLNLNAERLAITEYYPSDDLTDTINFISKTIDHAKNLFQTKIFLRVGFRVVYSQDFASAEQVTEAIYKIPIINIPETVKGEKGIFSAPAIVFGWQDKGKGINYRINSNNRRLTLQVPTMLLAKGLYTNGIEPYEDFTAVFDVDTFINKKIRVEKLFFKDWIKQAFETTKVDAKKILGDK